MYLEVQKNIGPQGQFSEVLDHRIRSVCEIAKILISCKVFSSEVSIPIVAAIGRYP